MSKKKRTQKSEPGIPKDFWIVPAYLPYVKPPLIEEAVRIAEDSLGVRLSKHYLEALHLQHGGYLRRTLVPDRDMVPFDVLWGIGPGFPSITETDWDIDKENIAEAGDAAMADLDRLVPFGGDGHWYLCFDYRGMDLDAEPSVVHVEVEGDFAIDPIAPTFLSFARGLLEDRQPPEPGRLGLYTDASTRAAALELEKGFKCTFFDAGVQRGVHEDAAYVDPSGHFVGSVDELGSVDQFGESDKAFKVLAISANRVPRGHGVSPVGVTLPGEALRYPEQPQCGIILEYLPEWEEWVRKKVADLPYRVVWL